MNKFIKRVATALMTIPLVLSSPLQSIAANDEGDMDPNGTGYGSYGGTSTVERVATAHAWHDNEGFRCYIVNNEGIPISNLVDFVNYYPWDMNTLKAASNWEIENIPGAREGVDKWFHVTGIFPNKGGDEYKEIIYLSGAKTDPVRGETIPGAARVYKDGHYPDGAGVKSVTRNNFKKDTTSISNVSLVEGKMYLISDLQKMLTNKITDGTGYSSPFSGNFDSRQEITYKNPETGQECVMLDYIPSALTSIRGNLVLTGEYMKNLMMRPVSIENWDKDKRLIINLFVDLQLPKANGLGNIVGGYEPIFELLDPEVKKYYDDCVTKYNALSEEEKKTTNTPMIETLKHYQAKLAFEPVGWSSPVTNFGTYGHQLKTLQPDPKYNQSLRKNEDGTHQIPDIYGDYYWSEDKIIYGTPTNESQYLARRLNQVVRATEEGKNMPNIDTNFDAWIQTLSNYEVLAGGGWMMLERTYRLEKEQYGLQPHDDRGMWLSEKASKWNTLGYGIMYFGMSLDDLITPTWDQKTYPKDNYKPGPSPENSNPDGSPKLPEYPSEGTSYEEKNTDHKFNIVKFYAEKNPDGSYIYKENHTRQQAIHTIQINDEPGYTVDSYYTSENFVQPTNPTDDYDVWKTAKAPKKTYEGTKADRVQVKATDPDTTLYIRLVSTPTLTIVKYFPNGSKTVEEIPWVPSYDSVEPGYEYEKDKQDPTKPDPIPENFDDTTGKPGTNPIIPVDPTSRIVYIKYKEVEADSKITLHQNELAHTFTLEDIQSLVTLTHSFASREKSGSGTHGSGSDRWHCSWHRVIDDDSYSYVISNKENYGATTFVGSQGAFTPQEIGTNIDSGSLGIGGGSTNGLTPNLKFSIYRDKAKDNVTLYPNKNNSVKGELAQIFITKEGYIPQTTRILDKGQTEWHSTFKINYTYDTEDNTLSWDSTGCSTHGDSGSWNGTPHPGLDTINNPFSQANNVLTKAYLGQPGKGDKVSSAADNSFTLSINGKTFNFNRNYKYKYTGDSDLLKGFNNHKKDYSSNQPRFFKFYPYTEMEYQTVADSSNKLAYIVSTNLSEVKDNTSIEVGVYQSGVGDTVFLDSEQWSTHARTIQGLRDQQVKENLLNKSLIPGGAVVKLSTANPNNSSPEVWVGFRSYEMSVPDDLKVTLSEDTGVKTTSQAKADGKTFFNDMKNNLSNYHLEKWIKEGIITDEREMNSGAKKVSGINTSGTAGSSVVNNFGGNQLSTDSKYYLKSNVNDATSSKFDVWNSSNNGNEEDDDFEQHMYRIYSDVYGKVTVTKDGSEIVSTNVKADKNLSGLLANTDVKRIDDRVKFVSNFIQSLDFEGGKDREAIPWYYEAHDGIEVVESLGFMQVGFNPKDRAIRSEVVDPKLTGKLVNRDDTLNFNDATIEEKTRTVQYKMSSSPTTNPQISGYVGDFNGEPIVIPGISEILKTRLHYMGNNTVMDLN